MHAFDVKLPHVPKTVSAVVSVVSGVLYSSTRLLVPSFTYTLPRLSTATAVGPSRLLALSPPLLAFLVMKLPAWPKTVSAVSLVSGVLYSSTRLLLLSATYRLPTRQPRLLLDRTGRWRSVV